MRLPRLRNVLRVAAGVLWMASPIFGQSQESKPIEAPPLDSRYSSEMRVKNPIVFEAHSVVTREDNVFNNNISKQGDLLFNEGALLSVQVRRPAWNVGLEYRPDFLFYRTQGAFNQFNQGLTLNAAAYATRHFVLSVKESLTYQTGILEPRANEDFSLPAAPPPNLNSTLFVPLSRELSNQTEADAILQVDRRSSFDFSGAYEFRHFSKNGTVLTTLFDTQGATGGFGYQYRVARHFTLGTQYLLQRFTFSRGFRDQTQSVFATVSWQARPSVTLSAFAGPQFSDVFGQSSAPSAGTIFIKRKSKQLDVGTGGALTLRSARTVLRFTGQRVVTDGGGLLNSATESLEGVELRRRLSRSVDIVLTGANSRTASLLGPSGRGIIRAQTAGAALEHTILDNLAAHIEYQFIRQRVSQGIPLGANVDGNRISIGLFYRTGLHPFQ